MQQVQNIQSHRVSNTLVVTNFNNNGRISKLVFVITKLFKEITSKTLTNNVFPQLVHD
jgi:hypothetical protein